MKSKDPFTHHSVSLSSEGFAVLTMWVSSVQPDKDPLILQNRDILALLFAFGTPSLLLKGSFYCFLKLKWMKVIFAGVYIFGNFMTPFGDLKMVSPKVYFWGHIWGIPTSEANSISTQLAPTAVTMPNPPMQWLSLMPKSSETQIQLNSGLEKQ